MFECDQLLLSALVLAADSGVPGLFFGNRSSVAAWIATVLMVASGALGQVGAALCSVRSEVSVLVFPLPLPDAALVMAADSLIRVPRRRLSEVYFQIEYLFEYNAIRRG